MHYYFTRIIFGFSLYYQFSPLNGSPVCKTFGQSSEAWHTKKWLVCFHACALYFCHLCCFFGKYNCRFDISMEFWFIQSSSLPTIRPESNACPWPHAQCLISVRYPHFFTVLICHFFRALLCHFFIFPCSHLAL